MADTEHSQAWTIAGTLGIGIAGPVTGSVRYASSSANWRATEQPGFWIKPLFEDVARGEKTLLMKVDPGAYAPMHTHPGEFEQVYVLEGAFYDRDAILRPGDFCCRAPNAPHEAGSVNGAVVLLIYTKC